MLVATAGDKGGRQLIVIGLSFANLDRFRQQPTDTFIKIEGAALGLPVDVMIFSARTEAEAADMIAGLVDEQTKVTISPKLKS